MQTQQQLRINAAPLTATFVLLAALAFGGIAGYAFGANVRSSPLTIPAAQQRGTLQFPAVTQPPAREPQNSYD